MDLHVPESYFNGKNKNTKYLAILWVCALFGDGENVTL